jgi:hypothetical protein
MNAIVIPNERLEREQQSTSLIQVIERAARDSSIDIDKMERLLAMKERLDARAAETAFNDAMNAAQAQMGPIAADATNPQTRSMYATYAKLDGRLRPIYTGNGFSISFGEGESKKPDHVLVLAYVSHKAGHTRVYQADMPADGKGAKGGDVMTKTHAVGAAKSYGKRYLLKDIFNIAIGEEDRDGNDPISFITENQIADLDALVSELGGNKAKLLKYLKLDAFKFIQAKNYDGVVAEVRRLAQARQERQS